MDTTFFIGSYTQMITSDFGGSGVGITSVKLNNETGELNVLHDIESKNAGYIALSEDKKYLYAITETFQADAPTVKAYEVRDDFSLEFINEEKIPGDLACHIYFQKNSIFITCYGSGTILMYPIHKTTGRVLPLIKQIIHTGDSVHVTRQESAHPHQICFSKKENLFFVPDLGLDLLKAYKQTSTGFGAVSALDVKINSGNGPRHMVFSEEGSLAFVINELTSNITVLKWNENKLNIVSELNSLPEDYQGIPAAAAIRLHPNGKYLYVANRGIDAIGVFEIRNEELKLIGFQKTNGNTLREFNISPDGNWLIACLQDSSELISYKIQENGFLIEKDRNTKVISPVCLMF